MPRTEPIVNGIEFLYTSVSNGDGTSLDVWVTVAANGRFSVRWLNGSSHDCLVTLKREGELGIPVVVSPGAGSTNAGNRQWSEWGNIEIQSAPRG
jgi:hypothetical protein